MDHAAVGQEGEQLSAAAFEQLAADERAARAFFRRRSPDGCAPCFYSLTHDASCTIATSTAERPATTTRGFQRALDADGHFALRPRNGARAQP